MPYHQLSRVTWIRNDGTVRKIIYPRSRVELIECVEDLRRSGIDFRIFGNTSNVFFDEEGMHEVLIFTQKLRNFGLEESGRVVAEAGAQLTAIANRSAKMGFVGLEGLVGVPATVGGAVVMNAGAYGDEIKDTCLNIEFWDEEEGLRTISAAEAGFRRRSSAFLRGELKGVVLGATFQLRKARPEEIQKRLEWVKHHRKTYQENRETNLGTLCVTPALYRLIVDANPGFKLLFGPLFWLMRKAGKCSLYREGFYPPEKQFFRDWENAIIKWYFRYPLSYRVHSRLSLNCYIRSEKAIPNDFKVYCDWLSKITRNQVQFENEFITGEKVKGS